MYVFGHIHKPWVRESEDVLFINDGSVGKPKIDVYCTTAKPGWGDVTRGGHR